ncbi:MAG TPA: cytochrome c oxidase subunit 3 [Caulobacteraceae bacterium]|jgi:cytochrome c oxidase subunit 3
MAHEGVHHDYHLVKPSIWPLIGAAAAVLLAWGLVVWMKGIFGLPKGTWWLLAVGIVGVLVTMAGWWTNVVREANEGDHTPVVSIGLRYGMILFIVSEVMFFVAWFWIFFEMALFHHVRTLSPIDDVRAAWATWPPKGVEVVPPFELPLINTLTLLLSGTTVTWAHHALQTGDRRGAKIGLAITIALGVLFTSIQAYEYNHILTDHMFYSEEASNAGLYGSAFFMATGFHGFHVIIGTIFLTVCLARLIAGGFTARQHFGFEAAAWYWHFVDVVWLFLFTFLYVTFGAGWGH